MARKKKAPAFDEMEQLEQSYSALTGKKIKNRQRRFHGLGFLFLLLMALGAGVWYVLTYLGLL